MRLTLLGTGTPTPSLARSSSSYLLEVGDDLILFDTGQGSYVRCDSLPSHAGFDWL